jgi:hypothetical protein
MRQTPVLRTLTTIAAPTIAPDRPQTARILRCSLAPVGRCHTNYVQSLRWVARIEPHGGQNPELHEASFPDSAALGESQILRCAQNDKGGALYRAALYRAARCW